MKVKEITIRRPMRWRGENDNYPYVAVIRFEDENNSDKSMDVPIYGHVVTKMLVAAMESVEECINSTIDDAKKAALEAIGEGA